MQPDRQQEKKPGKFARLFGKHKKSSSSVPIPPSTGVSRAAAAGPSSSSSESDEDSFSLRITKDLWPEFNANEGSSEGVGQLFFDFTDSVQKRWALGEDVNTQFAQSIFPPASCPPKTLPERLYDLVQGRTVLTSTLTGDIKYTAISHVWGNDVIEVEGTQYGVEWPIPVRRKVKLDQMLSAARVIGGLRYVWLDLFCLDQRKRNEAEIAKMGEYFAYASGCIVWLDNANGDADWRNVLSSMEEVNKFYKMDKSGVATISVAEMMRDGFANIQLTGVDALRWVRKIMAIEGAPWFKRVWTLQEGVIPDNIYFCTPERYLMGGAPLFQILMLCGMVAKLFFDTGAMAGMAIIHELQKSESWKILKLRQFYRRGRISYWHLYQATKTRSCKHEPDKVFGVVGLLPGRIPTIDYNRSLGQLWEDVYRSSIEQGDLTACYFIGDGETPFVPDSRCLPLIPTISSSPRESHGLELTAGAIKLVNVGADSVTSVWPIVTNGSLRIWKAPEFLDLNTRHHIDISKAFGMYDPSDDVKKLSPNAFAAISGMGPLPPDLLKVFGSEFEEKYQMQLPKAMLVWSKAGFLMQASEDNAFVVLWTASSEPQLGVVTERVEGNVCVVTPSSYLDSPGEGCLICKFNPDGTLKKIGLGMGMQVRASRKVTVLLV